MSAEKHERRYSIEVFNDRAVSANVIGVDIPPDTSHVFSDVQYEAVNGIMIAPFLQVEILGEAANPGEAIDTMTKDELLDQAKANGLKVTRSMNKGQIRAALNG